MSENNSNDKSNNDYYLNNNTDYSNDNDYSAAQAPQQPGAAVCSVSRTQRLLECIECWGNRLPDLNIIFLFAFIAVMLLSALLAALDVSLIHPLTHERIAAKNLLSVDEIGKLLVKMPANFINFPALQIVLVSALGVGIAEGSGLISAAVRALVRAAPSVVIVPAIIALSIAAHVISVSAYVFLMPAAALAYRCAGRHPVAGIATAFAALAGGFSANYFPSVVDPVMQRFAQDAARSIDPAYNVHVLANYFIGAASSVAVIGVCWWLSARVIEPMCERLLPLSGPRSLGVAGLGGPFGYEGVRPNYDADFSDDARDLAPLTAREKRALKAAGLTFALLALALAAACWPNDSALRGDGGSLSAANSVLMAGIVPIVLLALALPGAVYGRIARTLRTGAELAQCAASSLVPLTGFILFCFICAQFLYAFDASHISLLAAIAGAQALAALSLPSALSILGVLLFTSFLNILIPSATSKWAVLSAVFVPMLMLLGISPELTQAAYRAADSASNVITPLFPFYPLVLSYVQRYAPGAGMGTLSALMLPFGVGLWLALVAVLAVFWIFGIPLGFGGAKFSV